MRKGFEKGRCLLCNEDEDTIHISLKCLETRKWRVQFLSSKWLVLNEETAYKKIKNCTNAVELRNTGIYLYKIRCKWENKIRNL
jgi:HKD family nuclease